MADLLERNNLSRATVLFAVRDPLLKTGSRTRRTRRTASKKPEIRKNETRVRPAKDVDADSEYDAAVAPEQGFANLLLAARNIPDTCVQQLHELEVYEILRHEYLIIDREMAEVLGRLLAVP